LVHGEFCEGYAECENIAEGIGVVPQVFEIGVREMTISGKRGLLQGEDGDLFRMRHGKRAK